MIKTEHLIVANMKCQGCTSTIISELSRLKGVKEVNVDINHDSVTVVHDGADRKEITGLLHKLGYPEATEDNGLLLQLKSYASCFRGRINKH